MASIDNKKIRSNKRIFSALSKLASGVLWYARRGRQFGVEAYMNFCKRLPKEASILEEFYGEVVYERSIGEMITDYVDLSEDREVADTYIKIAEWMRCLEEFRLQLEIIECLSPTKEIDEYEDPSMQKGYTVRDEPDKNETDNNQIDFTTGFDQQVELEQQSELLNRIPSAVAIEKSRSGGEEKAPGVETALSDVEEDNRDEEQQGEEPNAVHFHSSAAKPSGSQVSQHFNASRDLTPVNFVSDKDRVPEAPLKTNLEIPKSSVVLGQFTTGNLITPKPPYPVRETFNHDAPVSFETKIPTRFKAHYGSEKLFPKILERDEKASSFKTVRTSKGLEDGSKASKSVAFKEDKQIGVNREVRTLDESEEVVEIRSEIDRMRIQAFSEREKYAKLEVEFEKLKRMVMKNSVQEKEPAEVESVNVKPTPSGYTVMRTFADPAMEPLKGGHQEVEEWFNNFDRVALASGWDEKVKGEMLPMKLKDQALRKWELMEKDQRLNYEKVKNYLIKKLDSVENLSEKMTRFNERVQRVDESVEDFSRELQKLVVKAFPDMPEKSRETLLAQRFSSGLRPRIKEKLMTADLNNFEECLLLAKRAERFLKSNEKDTMKLYDGELNAIDINKEKSVRFKPDSTQQKYTPKNIRYEDNNRSKYEPGNWKRNYSGRKCYRCGEQGHMAFQCRLEVCGVCGLRLTAGNLCSCLKGSAPM